MPAVIYVAKFCGYCHKAMEHLAAQKPEVRRKIVRVVEATENQTEVTKAGITGFPTLVDGASRYEGTDGVGRWIAANGGTAA